MMTVYNSLMELQADEDRTADERRLTQMIADATTLLAE
jgi:hypothetical protein